MSRKNSIIIGLISLLAIVLWQWTIGKDGVDHRAVEPSEAELFSAAPVQANVASVALLSVDQQGAYRFLQLPSLEAADYLVGQEIEFMLPSGEISNAPVVQILSAQTNPDRIISAVHWGESAMTDDARIIISMLAQNVTLELLNSQGQIYAAVLHDPQQNKIYRAEISAGGQGVFVEEDVNAYYCLKYPTDPEEGSELEDATPSEELIADINLLRNLQSNPNSSKVLYLDYWGGQTVNTAWNFVYNNNLPIDYAPFSLDNDINDFSAAERYLIWLGWLESAEDYAAFDINITTSEAVYNATSVRNRAKLNITDTDAWIGGGAGGVAYVGVFSFSSDYYKTGWVWNLTADSLGMSISHEAGHIMGLSHDGTSNRDYYSGHGDWGPIMGAPFGKEYVQWSQGDYPGASLQQNDIEIVESRLDYAVSDASNNEFSPTPLILPVNQQLGNIGLNQTAGNADHYQFTLDDSQSIEIDVTTVLGDEGEARAGNLAMTVSLSNTDTNAVIQTVAASEPLSPLTNVFQFSDNLAAGTYRLSIQADSPNTNFNTGFDNYGNGGLYRFSISGGAITAPDLSPAQTTMSAISVYAGQSVTISTVVENLGDEVADATTLFYYQSSDSIIDVSDTQLALDAISALAIGGASSSQSAAITAPTQVGTYWLGVCVSTVAGEVNTNNNCSVGLALEVQDPPDLVLDSLQVLPTQVYVNGTISLSVDVENAGDAASAETVLRYYRSNDASISNGDFEVATDVVSGLSQNVVSSESASFAAPAAASGYWYGACVDSVLGESNTANNCSAGVLLSVNERPDLAAINFQVDDTSLVSGQSVQFSASVYNNGAGTSNGTFLRFYLSSDANISTADELLENAAVAALPTLGQVSVAEAIVVSSSAQNVWLGACVDSVPGELVINNNCSSGTSVTVIEPADLIVNSLLLNTEAVNTNQSITVSATVQNIGEEVSANTNLRYYFSHDTVLSNDDGEFDSDTIAVLGANASSIETGQTLSPSEDGDYWVLACVDTFTGESNSGNNCAAVALSVVEGDIYEQDDGFAQSVDLQSEESQVHSIKPNNDVDWLRVTLAEQSSLKLIIDADNDGLTFVLYDEGQVPVSPTRYEKSSNDTVITADFEALSPGEYYVEVFGNGLEPSNYVITAQVTIPAIADCDFFTIPVENGGLVLVCL